MTETKRSKQEIFDEMLGVAKGLHKRLLWQAEFAKTEEMTLQYVKEATMVDIMAIQKLKKMEKGVKDKAYD